MSIQTTDMDISGLGLTCHTILCMQYKPSNYKLPRSSKSIKSRFGSCQNRKSRSGILAFKWKSCCRFNATSCKGHIWSPSFLGQFWALIKVIFVLNLSKLIPYQYEVWTFNSYSSWTINFHIGFDFLPSLFTSLLGTSQVLFSIDFDLDLLCSRWKIKIITQ